MTTSQLLDRLEAAKRTIGAGRDAQTLRLLESLRRRRMPDAASLIRLNESLLFFRAYPAGRDMVRLTEELLAAIPDRVEALRRAGADLEPFEEPDVSGIAGTAFSAIFSYDIARWLAGRHSSDVDIDWDACDPALLGPLLRRLHPYFNEDLLVEANIPYMDWFRAAKRGARASDLRWLIGRIEALPMAPADRAELFAGAKIAIRWELGRKPGTRTAMRLPGAVRTFYHDRPLLRRSDVSLAEELAAPPLEGRRLSRTGGERILNLMRETSALRYRELHGFTYGDPKSVDHVQFGRGVEVFVCGVPREHRLPLRAYHAGMFFKNGVPIGYVEVLTLFGRMEVGFNLYYTFREGETAWLYARVMRLFRHKLRVKCLAVDPYQIGLHNEEAIESGAFWFYRKLGFRPVDPKVARLLEAEEKKLRADPAYRTPPAVLRRLSRGWMLYELPGSQKGAWDHFNVRRWAMQKTR